MAYKNKNNKNTNKSKFNKDSKDKLNRKKDPKQQGKSSDNVTQKSYYPDYSQNLSLISRLRAGKPGSIVKVRHFEVGAVDVGTIDYLKSHITSAINTLATQRGYQSSVDFSVVEDYVDKLIELEITAATFVRTQNLVNLQDILGNPVGKAFCTISQDYITNPDQFFNASAFLINATYKKEAFSESISNHTYSTEFVSPMSKLLTTPHLHAQIAAYFGVIHQDIEGDDDSVYDVLWNNYTSTTFAELKTSIAALKSVILTYPDLELILKSIGFSTFEEIGEEFTRDRLQQSVLIRNDGFFKAMLYNSKVDVELVRGSASTPAQVVYTTNYSYPDTFLNNVSSLDNILDPQVSGISEINKIAYTNLKMFSTGMVFRSYNSISKNVYGTVNMISVKPISAISRWTFDGRLFGAAGGVGTGKLNHNYLINLFSTFRDSDMIIPDDGTRHAALTYEAASGPDPAFISIEISTISPTSSNLLETGNRLTISDALDAQLYLDNRKVFLLYGTVE